jgi:hypothetical protein
MSTELMPASHLPATIPADRHPAAIYLARLTPLSRRSMACALETVACIVQSLLRA